MSIEELMCVVPPPERIDEGGDADQMRRLQEQDDPKFPQDFYDFGIRYGTGRFVAFDLWVLNRFSPNWARQVQDLLEISASRRELNVEECPAGSDQPYPVYPERPGLFEWGGDSNGYGLYWFTQGEPKDWLTVLTQKHCDPPEFRMSMSTFIAKAINMEIQEPLRYHPTDKINLHHVFSNRFGRNQPSAYG
jgi:hypothetical protein